MSRMPKKCQFSPTGIVLSSVMALAVGCTFGCSGTESAQTVAAVPNQQSVTFFVDGMI